jgi:hypothetical protein
MYLLGNVDESILKLNNVLDHDFRVDEIDIMDEEFKIIQKLERLKDTTGTRNRLFNDYHCMCYTKVYCIQNVFNVPVDEFSSIRYDLIDKTDTKIIKEYVSSFVKKIRLFKGENLRIPIEYRYFKTEDGKIRLDSQTKWLKSELDNKFKLEDAELQELNEFMKDLIIPFEFEKPFLKNAFELFELSYYTFNFEIKALLLFMSMEVLFKSGKNCNSHCISENIASLLEDNQEDFEELRCKLIDYWKIRNDIAHEGNSKLNGHEIRDLIKKLRQYIRDSIIKMDNGQNKDKIIENLQGKFTTNKNN